MAHLETGRVLLSAAAAFRGFPRSHRPGESPRRTLDVGALLENPDLNPTDLLFLLPLADHATRSAGEQVFLDSGYLGSIMAGQPREVQDALRRHWTEQAK